jgi:phage FluMu protein Com
MAQNPLQEFYRQPKIFVSLPSGGIYNKLGSLTGDVSHMPIYSMTGMDEIIVKTPDALLSGDSTVSIINSCCPNVKDGWEVTSLDTDLLLTAIRIATFGNILEIIHVCPKCKEENEYDIELGTVIDHFTSCKYENTIQHNGLTIKLQPLTYRQTTEFSIRNFKLQQRLIVAGSQSEEEQKEIVSQLFKELGTIQNDIYSASIESVDTGKLVVTEPNFIFDWLTNCDKAVFDKIRDQFNINKESWKIPDVKVKCTSCGHDSEVSINLDQSNFFAPA